MTALAPSTGSARIPQAKSNIPPTDRLWMDRSLAVLHEAKDAWVGVDLVERIELLQAMRKDLARVADRWVVRACEAKGIALDTPPESEEWLGGPFSVARNLRLLEQTLMELLEHGEPQIRGEVRTLPSGQVAVGVFPYEGFDKLMYTGFEGEIWMDPGITEANLGEHTASLYKRKAAGEAVSGKVALVLGAGNVSSIGPMDALHKLFVEDQVVCLKMNPVNDYTGPFIAEAMQVLVEGGFLRITYGGVEEGKYLTSHELVEEIHITGSDKSHDAIVFGAGPEGARRKAKGERFNARRITSELGNVSPVIVVPGPWKAGEIDFHAQNLATQIANNAGFNCNATRVIITHKGWDQREALLARLEEVLASLPTRSAYYPGAEERHSSFVESHPDAVQKHDGRSDSLPWTLCRDLDASNPEDICFTTEAFCSVTSEVPLDASSTVDFLQRATAFANDQVWGTLNAALIIHPKTLEEPGVSEAFEQAIADLRVGAVVVNHWPALAYGLCVTTWGGISGSDVFDVQSGVGVVHNTQMFDRPQKSVIRGPFKIAPLPPWFSTNRNAHNVARKLFRFEVEPSWLKVPGIALASLKG